MRKYSEYKESGVQWMGEIPSHWAVTMFKKIAFVKSNLVHPNEFLSFPQVSPDCIEKNSGRLINYDTVANSNVISDNHLFYKGQIIYSKIRPLLNKVIIAPFDGLCSADMYPIETKQNPSFVKYYMLSNAFLEEVRMAVSDRVKMPKINQEELSKIRVTLPPLSEQQHIVSFLDKKTSQIDEYIATKEKEIEAMKEWKKALIARVVTKGLNKNAKMKDSGNSWIGEMPEHWSLRKMKYTFGERSEKNHPDEPVLCATQSQGVIPQSLYENRVVVVNKGFENLKFVHKGDFVISLRSFQGGIEYAWYQGIISAAYTILFPIENIIDPGYARFLLKSDGFIQLLKTCVTGIREGQNINYELLRKKFIPIPPLDEQRAIVDYIDHATKQADKMIVELTYHVEYMKEYKQRLIADVVTGKINVQP